MVPPEELDSRDRPAGATVTEGKIQSVGSSGAETPQTFFPPTLGTLSVPPIGTPYWEHQGSWVILPPGVRLLGVDGEHMHT